MKKFQTVVWWFPALVFLFLAGFAAWAWFERMNSDAGYYLFHTINKKWFYVEHQRYVLAVAELPALIAVYLHLPLKWVVVMYSLGHVCFFAFSALLSYRISRQTSLPLLISLLAIAGLRESVFTPQFELYYGLVFLVLAFSFYISDYKPVSKYAALFFCLFFAITSHPFCVMCALYLFVFYQIYTGKFKAIDTVVHTAIIILYYFWKKAVASGYESGKMDMFTRAITDGTWKEVLTLSTLKNQSLVLLKYYPDVLLFFVAGVISFMQTKKWLLLGFYVLSVVLFVALVWTLYPQSTYVFRYLEQVYFPMVFLVLIFLITANKIQSKALIALLIFTLAYRMVVILQAYPDFRERTQLMDKFIAKARVQKGQRFFVDKAQMGEKQYNLGDWSYGFETLVRSVSTGQGSITITKDEDLFYNGNDSLLKPDEYLFRMWEREKTQNLNPQYFKFDTGRYEEIKN